MPAFPVRLSAANEDEATVDAFDALMGYTLRALRIDKGVSLAELAHQVGMTPNILSLYEQGVFRLNAERLLGMAEALNTSVESFYAAWTS
jgi:transcriptional regulator with XRE-family HTH domain